VATTQPLFGLDLAELRTVNPAELLMRFAFGAATSVVAGLAGSLVGTVAGGLLLAFPAVLPAAATLVEQREGNDAAVHDVGGATFGAVGLIAFAAVSTTLFPRTSAPLALLAALAAWIVVSLTLYVLRATGVLPTPAPLLGERGLRGGRRWGSESGESGESADETRSSRGDRRAG
jgi:hypothetical protein